MTTKSDDTLFAGVTNLLTAAEGSFEMLGNELAKIAGRQPIDPHHVERLIAHCETMADEMRESRTSLQLRDAERGGRY